MPFPAGWRRKSPGLRRRPQQPDFPDGFAADDGSGEAGGEFGILPVNRQPAAHACDLALRQAPSHAPGRGITPRGEPAARHVGDWAELDTKSGATRIAREYFLCALRSDFAGYCTGFLECCVLNRYGFLVCMPGFGANVMVRDFMNCAGLMIGNFLDCGGKAWSGHTQGKDRYGNDFG